MIDAENKTKDDQQYEKYLQEENKKSAEQRKKEHQDKVKNDPNASLVIGELQDGAEGVKNFDKIDDLDAYEDVPEPEIVFQRDKRLEFLGNHFMQMERQENIKYKLKHK